MLVRTRREEERSTRARGNNGYTAKDIKARDLDLIIYSALILALSILSVWRVMDFFRVAMCSSVHLHKSMFNGVIRAPMRFFETNAAGTHV
jgi:hypothetical protein